MSVLFWGKALGEVLDQFELLLWQELDSLLFDDIEFESCHRFNSFFGLYH